MKKLYYLVCDVGDGSASVHWFKSEKVAQDLANNDEDYYLNEGNVKTLTLPDDTDLNTIGVRFHSKDKEA